MQSENSEPANELRLIIDTKRNSVSRTYEVVSESAKWLKSELSGSGIAFQHSECEHEDHYGFASFTIVRKYEGNAIALGVKVAEIKDEPYAFAEIVQMGKAGANLFPFFGELHSQEGRIRLLHYVADFVLSTAE